MKENKLTEKNNTLIRENIGYAKKLAKRFHHKLGRSWLSLEEIESAALAGLCDASRRYDAKTGNHFRTFAYYRIKGAMYDALSELGGLDRKSYNALIKEPNVSDINPPEYSELQHNSNFLYSFSSNAEELSGLIDIIEEVGFRLHADNSGNIDLSKKNELTPEDVSSMQCTKEYVEKLLKRLPPLERKIIKLKYFNEASFSEICDSIGDCSKSWVSRLHSKAIDSLGSMIAKDQNTTLAELYA